MVIIYIKISLRPLKVGLLNFFIKYQIIVYDIKSKAGNVINNKVSHDRSSDKKRFASSQDRNSSGYCRTCVEH